MYFVEIRMFQMNVGWSLFVIAVYVELACCDVELQLAKGTIKGKMLTSRDGRPYYSYTGVPYAKPPIGELRFKVYDMYETRRGPERICN